METKIRDTSAKTVKDITDATLKVNNFIIDGFLARTLSDSFPKLVKMTVRYCIGELVELGCQTAKKARITDAAWSAVKGLGINRSVRGTRAGKSVQRKKTLIRNATPATTFSPPSPSPLDPRTANPGSRVEPVRPRTIQRRHLISIGTFNSRTLTDDARLLELVKLAKDMKLDV